jgi:hypothetical protein
VNKNLILKLGKTIEKQWAIKEQRQYTFDSNTDVFNSNDIVEFTSFEWPKEFTKIRLIGGDYFKSPHIIIEIYSNSSSLNNIEIISDNSIWTNGVYSNLRDIINEHKLCYSFFFDSFIKKMITVISLAFVLIFGMEVFILKIFPQYTSVFNAFLQIIFIVNVFFMDWLFPYIRYGSQIQVKIRNIIIGYIILTWGIYIQGIISQLLS